MDEREGWDIREWNLYPKNETKKNRKRKTSQKGGEKKGQVRRSSQRVQKGRKIRNQYAPTLKHNSKRTWYQERSTVSKRQKNSSVTKEGYQKPQTHKGPSQRRRLSRRLAFGWNRGISTSLEEHRGTKSRKKDRDPLIMRTTSD